MWAFLYWLVEWAGFALVSLWVVLDHLARLVAVGIVARLAWRSKDDDGAQAV
jgi:hydrogenase/urease accessory protein HupE